jgi:hypothetical protein
MIPIIYENIQRIYVDIFTNVGTTRAKQTFINNILRRFNLNDLKAVGLRYTTTVRGNNNKTQFATALWDHFSENMNIDNYLHSRWLQVFHPEREQEQEQTWTIDRTPQQVPIPLPIPLPLPLPIYDLNTYVPASDEFIPFPRILEHEFDEVVTTKKYYISTVLSCQETDEELEKTHECSICYEHVKLLDTVTLNCNHNFCYTCIHTICQTNQTRSTPCCALCREPMTTFVVKHDELFETISEHCRV